MWKTTKEPSSYNTKSFHGSSDFVVVAWRRFRITLVYKRYIYYTLCFEFKVKRRDTTNSLTTLPSLNKKIYSFITFQKLSSASNYEFLDFLHFLDRAYKMLQRCKMLRIKGSTQSSKVSIKIETGRDLK